MKTLIAELEKNHPHYSKVKEALNAGIDPALLNTLHDYESHAPRQISPLYQLLRHYLSWQDDDDEDERLAMVTLLLSAGANPNCVAYKQNGTSYTPLQILIQNDRSSVKSIQILLRYGADPNLLTEENIFQQFLLGETNKPVEYFMSPLDKTNGTLYHDRDVTYTSDEMTARWEASKQRTSFLKKKRGLKVLELLLKFGLNPNTKIKSQTLLQGLIHRSTRSPLGEFFSKLATLLILNGADLSVTDADGKTLLQTVGRIDLFECLREKTPLLLKDLTLHDRSALHIPEVTRLLVGRGDDINAQDKEGNTPLMCAIIRNQLNTPYVLISGGANLLALNNQSFSPETYLTKKIHETPSVLYLKGIDDDERLYCLVAMAYTKSLMQEKINNTSLGFSHKLFNAVFVNNIILAQSLLDANPAWNINSILEGKQSQHSYSLMHVCAKSIHNDVRHMLMLLLQRGGDPNLSDPTTGETPLISHLKYKERHLDLGLINILLAYGADPRIADVTKKTPLDYCTEIHAYKYYAEDAILSLFRYGADIDIKKIHDLWFMNEFMRGGFFNTKNQGLKGEKRYRKANPWNLTPNEDEPFDLFFRKMLLPENRFIAVKTFHTNLAICPYPDDKFPGPSVNLQNMFKYLEPQLTDFALNVITALKILSKDYQLISREFSETEFQQAAELVFELYELDLRLSEALKKSSGFKEHVEPEAAQCIQRACSRRLFAKQLQSRIEQTIKGRCYCRMMVASASLLFSSAGTLGISGTMGALLINPALFAVAGAIAIVALMGVIAFSVNFNKVCSTIRQRKRIWKSLCSMPRPQEDASLQT